MRRAWWAVGGFLAGTLLAQAALPLLDRAVLLNPTRLAERLLPEQRLVRRDGVACFDYGHSVECNPAIIALVAWRKDMPRALAGDSGARRDVLRAADWLASHAHAHGPGLSLPFDFVPRGTSIRVPWYSALADGSSLPVLAYAHRETGDARYLRTARGLLTSLETPMERGGVARPTARGAWLEEYAGAPSLAAYVLNGHTFALNGLSDYVTMTGDPRARRIRNRAAAALEERIVEFDAAGWQRYDLLSGSRASNRYLAVTTAEIDRVRADVPLPELRRMRHHWWHRGLWTRMVRWRGRTRMLHVAWWLAWGAAGVVLALQLRRIAVRR